MARRDGTSNILIIMTDQLTAFATTAYGNADVLTPHLDTLARRGTLFERAYCNSPLCVPSRASMMTGQLPSHLPVNDNGEELPASVPTFAHHLRRAGYRTCLSGKMHFVGPDQLHGFEERLTTDIYPSDFLWTPSWPRLREIVRRAETGERVDPSRVRNAMADCVRTAGPTPRSHQVAYDEEVQFRALEWLRGPATRAGERPWLLCVSFTHPHDPYNAATRYWDRYAERAITLPEPPPAGFAPPAVDVWVDIHHGIPEVMPTPVEIERARRGYYANTSYIDDKLGELVGALADLDLADDTVIVFTSDHGDMLGEHGMWFKRTVREWSARVPLIVAGPEVVAGQRRSENVSLLDLFPTFLDLVGVGIPRDYEAYAPPLDGRSLLPSLHGMPWEGPNEVTVEYNGDGTIAPIRALIRGGWKYVYTHGAPEQLYDLARDPNEWHDRSSDPGCAMILSELRAALLGSWDPVEAERRVLASQRRRTFLNEALYQGTYTPWDFQPTFDASRTHTRPNRSRHWASLVYERVLLDSHDQRGLLEAPNAGQDESTEADP